MALVRPCVAPYCPVGHRVQLPVPPMLYRPMAQMLAVGEVDPAGHEYPGLQGPTQLLLVCPPTSPYCPELHCPVQELVVAPLLP